MRRADQTKARPRRDPSGAFTSVGQALNRSGHPVLEEAVSRYRALSPLKTAWQRAVAQPVYCHTQPVSLRDGVLTVHAESPVWANLLRNTEHSVLAALPEAGLSGVHSLRIRIAPPKPARDNHDPPAAERTEDNEKFRRLFAQLRKALD